MMIAAAIAAGFLLSLLLLGWWILRRRESGLVKDAVDDPALLAEAEAGAPADTGPLVALARYSSSEGMRDGDVVEIMARLNAQGFHVSYRTVIAGEPGGALVDYVLEVPPEEWAAASRALKGILEAS